MRQQPTYRWVVRGVLCCCIVSVCFVFRQIAPPSGAVIVHVPDSAQQLADDDRTNQTHATTLFLEDEAKGSNRNSPASQWRLDRGKTPSTPSPETGTVGPLLAPQWRLKYGEHVEPLVPKPVVWVICTGIHPADDVAAFHRLRQSEDVVVTLNKFLFLGRTMRLNITPTHHWLVETGPVVSGECAQSARKRKSSEIPSKNECFIAGKVIKKAHSLGTKLVGKTPVLEYARALEGNTMDHLLLEDESFRSENPLPIDLSALTLGHGLQIALGLSPRGALIKLFGCDGTDTFSKTRKHKNLDDVTQKLGNKVALLSRMRPGWDIINCNTESLYVRAGLMPGGNCFDRD